MNDIISIHPYKHRGFWVFDDAAADLVREPFIAGVDTVIDAMVADIPGAEAGFTLLFSADPFPGHQTVLGRRRQDMGGIWYNCTELDMEGWLCPALVSYFENAPDRIYAQFSRKAG